MTIPPIGTPVGLEVPAKDVARGSAFYSAVFNWSFAPSSLGLPEEKLLTFSVPGGAFPIGGALRLVDVENLASTASTKLYLYVEDITAAMVVSTQSHIHQAPIVREFKTQLQKASNIYWFIKAIERNGGRKASNVIPEGSKAFFQFFEDTEGNGHVIYTYAK